MRNIFFILLILSIVFTVQAGETVSEKKSVANRRAFTLPSWAKKGLLKAKKVIVAVVSKCAKKKSFKQKNVNVLKMQKKVKDFVNKTINKWVKRRLWGWGNITAFVHKAVHKASAVVHKVAKVANKLSGGALCKAAANVGCPLLSKAVQSAGLAQKIPHQLVQTCLKDVVEDQCRKVISGICARRLYELQVKRITRVLKQKPGQVRRTFLIPGFIKKGLREAAGTIVKVLSSCAKKQAKKFGLPVGGIINTITKLINGVLDKLLKRRLGFFSWISNAVKKVGHFVAKAVKTGVKFANKLSGGMLCKAAANFGCPAAIQLLKTVALQVHIPPQLLPGCMTDILRKECKKLIFGLCKRRRELLLKQKSRRLMSEEKSLQNYLNQ